MLGGRGGRGLRGGEGVTMDMSSIDRFADEAIADMLATGRPKMSQGLEGAADRDQGERHHQGCHASAAPTVSSPTRPRRCLSPAPASLSRGSPAPGCHPPQFYPKSARQPDGDAAHSALGWGRLPGAPSEPPAKTQPRSLRRGFSFRRQATEGAKQGCSTGGLHKRGDRSPDRTPRLRVRAPYLPYLDPLG